MSLSLALAGLIVAGLIVSAERLSAAEVPVREGFDALGISGVVLGGSVVVLWFAASAFVAAGWLLARETDLSEPKRRAIVIAAATVAVLLALVLNPDGYATDPTLIAATVLGFLSVHAAVRSAGALGAALRQPQRFAVAWSRFFDGAGHPHRLHRRFVSAGRVLSVILLGLTIGIVATIEAKLGRNWAIGLLVSLAWLFFRIGQGPLRPARLTMRRRLIGVTVFAACLLTLLREHHWLGVVAGTICLLAAITCVLVRQTNVVPAVPVVLVFAGVVWGGVAGWSEAHEFPTARSLVAQRGEDLFCGIYIASRDGNRGYWDKTLGQFVWAREADTTLGPTVPVEGFPSAVRKVAQAVLARGGLPPVPDPTLLCRRDSAATPSPDFGLAEQFAPRLVLDEDDGFWPVSALTMFQLRKGRTRTCVERAPDGCPDPLRDPADLPWLGGAGQWLELPDRDDDRQAQHRAMLAVLGTATPAESGRFYYLVTGTPGDRRPVGIQYWFYYVFNYQPVPTAKLLPHFPAGFHEGDFEHVEVVLSTDAKTPRYVWFARHDTEGRAFTWDELKSARLTVFAARGSHASYESCGRKPRWEAGGRAPDLPVCEGADSAVIERAQLTDLARTAWACWRGGFGHRAPGQDTDLRGIFGKGPQSPLWQQPGRAEPCLAVADDPRPRPQPGAEPDEMVIGQEAAQQLRDAAGRPEGRMDRCSDWIQPPTQGAYLVACDPAALGRFFGSGLTDLDANATLRLAVPGAEVPASVPAVHRDLAVGGFSGWTITATAGLRPLVYAACLDPAKHAVEATFAASDYREPLRAGRAVRVDDTHADVWRLIDSDGSVYAQVAPRRPLTVPKDDVAQPGEHVTASCGGAR